MNTVKQVLPVCAALCAMCVLLSLMLTVFPNAAVLTVGDLDRDGAASTDDARTVLRFVVGSCSLTRQQYLIADCNGDGRADTTDACIILRAATGGETLPAASFATTSVSTSVTVATTTTAAPSLDDDGYYDDIVKP